MSVYFGGKLIRADGVSVVTDRLGSVVARGCNLCWDVARKDYFPYGEEIAGSTAGNMEKFGTYHRDQTSGLDYADQRYFASLNGRFLTSDPYEASGGAGEPSSWNQYPYVGGDPVNRTDQTGQYWAHIDSLMAEDGGIIAGGGGGLLGTFGGLPGVTGSPGCVMPGFGNPWAPITTIPNWSMMNCGPLFPTPPPPSAANRRPKFLKVTDDCYRIPSKGAATREIRYELFDDVSPANRYVDAIVTEHLVGDLPSTGAVMSGLPNGVFQDQLSTYTGQIVQQLTQSFTADALDDNFGPIPVTIIGFGGESGSLNITKYRGFVKINGDFGGVFDSRGRFIPNKICD